LDDPPDATDDAACLDDPAAASADTVSEAAAPPRIPFCQATGAWALPDCGTASGATRAAAPPAGTMVPGTPGSSGATPPVTGDRAPVTGNRADDTETVTGA